MSDTPPRLPRIVVAVAMDAARPDAFTLLREPETINATITRLHHVDGATLVRTATLREVYDPSSHVAVRDDDLDLDLSASITDDEMYVLAVRAIKARHASDDALRLQPQVTAELAVLGGPMPAPRTPVTPATSSVTLHRNGAE